MNDNKTLLRQVLTDEAETLHNIIRSYVYKMGLAQGDAIDTQTQEIMSEMTISALQNANQYDPTRRPIPWLLGIAINRIRRCLYARQKANAREINIQDFATHDTTLTEDDLFDYVRQQLGNTDDIRSLENNVDAYLAPLSQADRDIIRLSVIHEMNSVMIAGLLDSTPTAVRVRLHRALKRLRGHINMDEVLNHDN